MIRLQQAQFLGVIIENKIYYNSHSSYIHTKHLKGFSSFPK